MITFPFSYSCSFSEFIFGFVFYLNRFLESNTLHKVPLLLFGASLVAQMVKKVKVLVTQSCPTLCDPMDWRPPGSSVHGILQARILEWVAISFSRGSSWPRDQTWVSYTGRQILYCWAIREALWKLMIVNSLLCLGLVIRVASSLNLIVVFWDSKVLLGRCIHVDGSFRIRFLIFF